MHDLEEGKTLLFPLSDLHKQIHAFAFIPGYKQHKFENEEPVNIKAVELLGNLHDRLKENGYIGHPLERFLVRILFCLFADDTGLFERGIFTLMLENTKEDGTDLGPLLAHAFEVLNTSQDKRQKNLDENLVSLPFVDGTLFEEKLPIATFNSSMREALIHCARFDWSLISPAIFGSLFQSVMKLEERRQRGGHYTTERNILKVIKPLFLDDLKAEFERVKYNKQRLNEFHKKLGNLTFFDPACGCGNFLVIAYRELRLLEIDVLKALKSTQMYTDISLLSIVNVDSMFGIEINEFATRIAEVALWLMDHKMNLMLSDVFGQYYYRLPLKKSATIIHGNALRIDWSHILAPEKCSYILSNPPYAGKKSRNKEQQDDMELIFAGSKGTGILDYVSCWYLRAAQYIKDTKIKVGFVSTNSITQGEQTGILWPVLFNKFAVKIHFAHRTFQWESEARGKAHVHVVIIGFACFDASEKAIYDYEVSGAEAIIVKVSNIGPYLIEGRETVIQKRKHPLCCVPEMKYGNMPNDNGFFLLSKQEKQDLLSKEPRAKEFIKPYLSAWEYLHGEERWCIWLKDATPGKILTIPLIRNRVEEVKKYRESSQRETTQALANTPMLFGEIRQPQADFVLFPRHTSEDRQYIPLSYFKPEYIIGDSCLSLSDATLWHFGILSSKMHMSWVKSVCGRLESRYRYSIELVYNNYLWPEKPTDKQIKEVEVASKAVLNTRNEFSNSTLADLYDPLSMPPKLVRAHADLDRVVDRCYRSQPFTSDRQRVEYLFALYEKLIAPLAPQQLRRKQLKKPVSG